MVILQTFLDKQNICLANCVYKELMTNLREAFFSIGFSMALGWGTACPQNANVMNTVVGLRYLVDSLRKASTSSGLTSSSNAIFIS